MLQIKARHGRKPEILKLLTARWVCAPYNAPAGTGSSPNESFSDGPAAGLRSVRTRRPVAALETLPRVIRELHQLVEAGDREKLAQTCLAAADALQ